jgi:hypothetical protein
MFHHPRVETMGSNSDRQDDPVPSRRAYSEPVLKRLGTRRELTRSVGHKGAKDGRDRGSDKRTSW